MSEQKNLLALYMPHRESSQISTGLDIFFFSAAPQIDWLCKSASTSYIICYLSKCAHAEYDPVTLFMNKAQEYLKWKVFKWVYSYNVSCNFELCVGMATHTVRLINLWQRKSCPDVWFLIEPVFSGQVFAPVKHQLKSLSSSMGQCVWCTHRFRTIFDWRGFPSGSCF